MRRCVLTVTAAVLGWGLPVLAAPQANPKAAPKAAPDPAMSAKLAELAAQAETGSESARVSAVERLAPFGEAALPTLRKLIGSDQPANVRFTAALTLGKLGPAAAPAIPELLRLTVDQTLVLMPNRQPVSVGLGCVIALTRLNEFAEPAVRAALADHAQPPILRLSALLVLSQIMAAKQNKTEAEALALMRGFLRDPHQELRSVTAEPPMCCGGCCGRASIPSRRCRRCWRRWTTSSCGPLARMAAPGRRRCRRLFDESASRRSLSWWFACATSGR